MNRPDLNFHWIEIGQKAKSIYVGAFSDLTLHNISRNLKRNVRSQRSDVYMVIADH